MISRKMLRAFYVLLCLYVPMMIVSSDQEELTDEFRYEYINEEHQVMVQIALDTQKTPQDLRNFLNTLDLEKKTILLNTAFLKRSVLDEDNVRCTTLVKELIINPPDHNGATHINNALKIHHLIEHGYQPNENLMLDERPHGILHICTLPLLDAVYMGNVEVTQLLLAHNANPDKNDASMMMRSANPAEIYSPRRILNHCLEDTAQEQNNAGDTEIVPPAPRNRYELIAQLFNKE